MVNRATKGASGLVLTTTMIFINVYQTFECSANVFVGIRTWKVNIGSCALFCNKVGRVIECMRDDTNGFGGGIDIE